MRIAVGGFLHESHSFAPLPTRYADFRHPGGFPGLASGSDVLAAVRPTSVALAGAVAAADAAGATLVPTTWCFANPAGPVEDEAFERIAALIVAGLSAALDAAPLDGVYLDLHGAMVVGSFPDGEGELLRRVRAVVGEVPLTISLDPHVNLTRAMVERVDALVPYRTYPHVDMKETGARAMGLLLERIRRGRPWARAWRQFDCLIPITAQCTLVAPMQPLMERREALAAAPGVAELAFGFGFPYADFADCGPAVAAYADTEAGADAAVAALHAAVAEAEPGFAMEVLDAAEAVRRAVAAPPRGAPVVIADTQDNPGGGGHGDTTGLLAELVRQDARDAVLALINDADSAARCHVAGEGAELSLDLGGRSDGAPLAVRATVERLTDGRFLCTGPMAKGNPAALGPTALIRIGAGVRVIVTSRKMQALDQALLRHVGIEPAACGIIVLKSSVHFRADFQPIAATVLVAAAPGPVLADPGALPFRHLRPGLRLRPMANRPEA